MSKVVSLVGLASLSLAALAIGCAAGGSADRTTTPIADGGVDAATADVGVDTGPVPGDDGGGLLLDATPDVPPVSGECAKETQQVYAITKAGQLQRFDPLTAKFTLVGTVDCAAGTATPFSMAVDRSGAAWILYNDGHIFQASTLTAKCTSTAFKADQHGFHTFGMAFVTDTAGGSAETLFVVDAAGTGLGKVDPKTLTLTAIGTGGDTYVPAELTGRSDGKLFAFFQRTPFGSSSPRVSEIDKATGKILSSKDVPGVDVGLGFAFAHWGGDYWLFTAPSGSTVVTDFVYATAMSTDVVPNAGFKVVGAGVSTCAPLVRPM
jgi:hypothetical protein